MNKAKKILLTSLTFASLVAAAVGVSACGGAKPKAHSHQWNDWTVATAPTDGAEGKATRTCSGDGSCDAADADKEYALPALTSADYTKGADSATCTAAGSVTYSYNKNGVSVSFAVATSAKGHGTLTAHDAKAKNCVEDGYAAYWECPDCGWLFSDAAGANKINAPVADAARGAHGELTYHEAVKVADCAEPGTRAYWECPDCEWLFSDAEGENKIDAPVASNHPEAEKTEAVEATCTAEGKAAYWTCSECGKLFSDEACTDEVTDLADLDTDALGHKLKFVEGEGASCYAVGFDDYWQCERCETLFSNAEGTTTIANPVTYHKHPQAVMDTTNTPASKTVSSIQFQARTRYLCPDCGKYIVVSGSSYEEIASDLLYTVRSGVGYWLFDKTSGVTATVNMPQAAGGITFVAPETGIYTFTFGEGASIETVYWRQGTTNTIVYENGWKSVAQADCFDKTADTLTNTVTFEVDKNSTVIVKLSSGIFSATYTYQKCYEVHFNKSYNVKPIAASEWTDYLVADVPEAGNYLVTISNLSSYFDGSATFTINTDTASQTTTGGKPVSLALSPKMPFSITVSGNIFADNTYSYDVTITQLKGTLQVDDNSVNITVANSDLYIDAYTFTATKTEKYTFTAPSGVILKIVEKGITTTAGGKGAVSLNANEKVTVVLKGAVNSYTLNIAEGESFDPLPNNTTAISFAAQGVKTYSVPSVVTEAGTYKITIAASNMNSAIIAFGLNKPTEDYVEFAGENSNAGTSDLIYGGFSNFYKSPAAGSGITATGATKYCYITLTLQPGDKLTFASAYANSYQITIAKV